MIPEEVIPEELAEDEIDPEELEEIPRDADLPADEEVPEPPA